MAIFSTPSSGSVRAGRSLSMPLSGVIYLRASQDRSGAAVSVDSQLKIGLQFFRDNDIKHVATYSDNNLSGSTFATEVRGGYELTVDAMRSGLGNLVWTWDSARAQRDIGVYARLRELCRETGGFWAYGNRIYDIRDPKDRRDSAKDAVEAEGRSDEISLNTRRGVWSRAERGEHAGTVAYGYRPVYSPETGRSLGWAVVEEEAEVIRRIVAWVLERKPLSWIARELNGEGVPCPHDRRWDKRYVARLVEHHRYPEEWLRLMSELSPEECENAAAIVAEVRGGQTPKEVARALNRAGVKRIFRCEWDAGKVRRLALSAPSAGLRVYHGEVAMREVVDESGGVRAVPLETRWEPIKTLEQHEQVVALLSAPEHGKVRDGNRVKYRWSGIVVCGVCGGNTTVVTNAGKLRMRCYRRSCVVREYAPLDLWLTESALSLLERENAASLFRLDEADTGQARAAQRKAQQLRARLDGLRAQAMAGGITPESFAMFESGLLPEIARQDELARRVTVPPSLVSLLAERQTDLRQVFLGMSVVEQREILRTIMRPRLLRASRKRGPFDPGAVDLGVRSAPAATPVQEATTAA
ncbi:recombinase family protein [Actinosynnema mirum]|uniref:Recombinase n=1 Tax=Actinosynnema mirum (strain ATCC 29888 / DSM 43827 / JCM 3225 / NBRC 14064 / NCIMB 13271 / NRRL B-12336 / IMRU 3971 / 101) TaxID=446462 RepID=C6W8P8_ACTMD|nr:recombinase family protein [Actinosynnema mirum]ACU37147.1 Recombinase [Actinosynnema mirum DSM 43827]